MGFSDWGTWWQGEIAGEYFLSNSNLRSQFQSILSRGGADKLIRRGRDKLAAGVAGIDSEREQL